MRVKLEWLNELVDLTGLSTKDIVDRASLYSIEIENVDHMIKASNIVIGHVLTKTKHPDSDHLNCLTVDVGSEVLNIVCGAPNVEAGQYVIVALVGCVLAGGEIKKSKIRGQESCGMCCSLQELGVENKYIDEKFAKGIYYFEEGATVGMEGSKALNWQDDILELGITPNRGDLLSMVGVAYEFSASFNRPLKPFTFKLEREISNKTLDIKIDTKGCVGYYGQLIQGVEVKPSPRWLSSRLIAFGIRSINLLVDITNYILALYGQPLHAFDYDLLGNKIVIKNAKENEKFITLDNIERTLKDTDVVITNGNDTMCLGGVMGGLNSEITENTKNIMLEAAVFDPMTIRRTATRLNLHSEASARYERGVDINRTKEALDYACFLFKTLGNAKIVGEPVVAGISHIDDKEITITREKINRVLGTDIQMDELIEIFTKLSFKAKETEKDTLVVSVPNRRPDITIKEDLIEEVGRLHGYEFLPNTLPLDRNAGELPLKTKNKNKVMDTLVGLGLNEVVTYSLVSENDNKLFNILNKEDIKPIEILMPLIEDRKQLRYSLVPSMINVLKYNYSRKIKNIAQFEIGNVYYMLNGESKEDLHLAITMTNEYSNVLWQGKKENVDFYLVKGILNQVADKIGIELNYVTLNKECNEMHPNRTALVYYNEELVGYIGQLHPEYAHKNEIDDVYVVEMDLSKIINYEKETIRYEAMAKLPSVERDIALIMKKDVLASDVIACIRKSDKQYLTDAYIFDLYQGEKIGEDEKSIAVKLVFTSNEPLTDDIINGKIKRILKDLQYKLNINLRS